jgi:hypothetical protein
LIEGYSQGQKILINTVYDKTLTDKISKNYYEKDVNKDGKIDIVMRDANNIYVKYNEQEDKNANSKTHSNYYASSKISSPEDLAKNDE